MERDGFAEQTGSATERSTIKAILGFILGFVAPLLAFSALLGSHMDQIAQMLNSAPFWMHGLAMLFFTVVTVWVIGYGVSGGLPP